jgi:hypothetical protein
VNQTCLLSGVAAMFGQNGLALWNLTDNPVIGNGYNFGVRCEGGADIAKFAVGSCTHAREDRMPENFMSSWIVWAMLSAAFAALTAIFAKVGVETVNSDLATFIRTVVILAVLGAILAARGLFQPLTSISARTYLFLSLSGLATGASWLC